VGRVAGAALLGGLVGFERELTEKTAGFRTHIVVSLGAALFTLAGAYGVPDFIGVHGTSFDPTRVAAQIVTGIGFLGAGAIIQQGLTVRGLTTAGALWVTAAIGMAAGFGYWSGAVATTVATVVCLYLLRRFEDNVIPRFRRGRSTLMIDGGATLDITELDQVLERHGLQLEELRFSVVEAGARHVFAIVNAPAGARTETLLQHLSELKGVENVDWTR
jgi:putative Mg2+ transporter-C (MgtC) family protein